MVGGDISSSPTLTIAVTALGDLHGVVAGPARRRPRRATCVAVAGRLGYAAAGLTILTRGFRSPKVIVDAYRRPIVPYHSGPAAARMGATSMIDVSDGLLQDLGHVAERQRRTPGLSTASCSRSGRRLGDVASALGVDPYTWILTGGDDHALAATFPPDAHLTDEWRVIGRVEAGTGVTVDGKRV